jgi:hypothetical protein
MKYVIGVVAVIIATILAVVLILGRNDTPEQPGQTGTQAVSLYDKAKDGGTVRYTIEGQLVGEDERRAVRITISSGIRKVEVLRGYNESVVKTQTFSNTSAGFEEFLKALEVAGFSRKRTYEPEDERGVCPLGRRYIYEFEKSGEDPVKTWSTSCSEKQGTFGGGAVTVRKLFQNQIPDYTKFVKDVEL